jgi:UDP-glucose:(heptosyl)LPS alpha-1,3-glucosyltransferase
MLTLEKRVCEAGIEHSPERPQPRRMKIAFVVHDYHSEGGHSRYVVELAKRFSRDHDVHVYANRFRPASASGITFHRIPAWRRSAVTTILSFMVPALLIEAGGYDIVHSQGLCSWRSNVITAHVCGMAWHEARRRIEKFIWKDYLFEYIINPLEKLFYKLNPASKVIAISDQVKNDLTSFYSCTNDISVIHHGVDLASFSPERREHLRRSMREELGLKDGEFVALYVGDLRKGALCALRAIAMTRDIKMIFVSRTDPAAYLVAAQDSGVAGRAFFKPATTSIERYYAAADCFLFPSSYDAFGMVVSEAMAMGLPVISSRAAGASEWIEHAVNGFVVGDAANAAEFARYLEALRTDHLLRGRLSAEARRSAEAHCWDSVAGLTMDVYQKAMREAKS